MAKMIVALFVVALDIIKKRTALVVNKNAHTICVSIFII